MSKQIDGLEIDDATVCLIQDSCIDLNHSSG